MMLVILNLPLIGLWVKPLTYPTTCSSRSSCRSARSASTASIRMSMTFISSLASVCSAMCWSSCAASRRPCLLGFILGPMIDENLRRAMIMSRGDPMTFLSRPISAGLLAFTVIVLVIVLLPSVRKKREEVFVEEE